MKKNIIVIATIGMLLLSCFMIPPAVADGIGVDISNEQPVNGATNVSILLSNLSFQLNESQGKFMEYKVETSPNIGSGSGIDVSNGTYNVSVSSPLDWNTVYTWYINVTNGTEWTNATYYFTTVEYNEPPVANFTYVAHGLKVEFNSSLSNDSDGTIESYYWDFGDGTNSTEENPVQYYLADGEYAVNLTVTDDDDATASLIKIINVSNAPPVANFIYSAEGRKVKFNSTSNDVDGNIVNYTWDFGDGNISDEENPTHTYAEEYTTYAVTLNVTDNMEETNATSKDIKTGDTTIPVIELVKPVKGLYINGELKRARLFRMALIIGDITIEVNATDENGSGIERVNFYIDSFRNRGEPVANDTTAPYTYNWTRGRIRFFHIHIIKVEAIDNAGNIAITQGMIVRKIL